MYMYLWFSLQFIEMVRSEIERTFADDSLVSTDDILIIFRLPDGSKLERKFSPSGLVKV